MQRTRGPQFTLAFVITGTIVALLTVVSAASVVTRSILKPGNYTGLFPIDDNAAWEKNAATLKQLHTLRDRLKRIEKSLGGKLQNTEEKS